MERFTEIYSDIRSLKARDKEKDQEIESLKEEIEKLKNQKAPKSEVEEINSKFQTLNSQFKTFKTSQGELVTAVQHQGDQIEKIKNEKKTFENWTTLVTVQETCYQLRSLTGLMNNGKKDLIDPDGRRTGNIPIEVRIL